MCKVRSFFCALIMAAAGGVAFADAASIRFVVAAVPAGNLPTCVNEALSVQSNAIVRVFCTTGEFARIEANPNKRFLGTHGGAFRYRLGSQTASDFQSSPNKSALSRGRIGELTAHRTVSATDTETALEIEVSF